jgi:putative ATP-dependent endonuclease of OLD family
MLSKIKHSEEETKSIEEMIEALNQEMVSNSDILSNIKTNLEYLDTAMGTHGEGVRITPFAKNLRDLNKSLSIYYADQQDSFSMEISWHGDKKLVFTFNIEVFYFFSFVKCPEI